MRCWLSLPERHTRLRRKLVVVQSFPTTPKVIYDTLVADAEFMSHLGQYRFKAGQTAPAISIVTPGRELPSVNTVTGIEVIIHDVANLERKNYLTGDADIDATWTMFLICWEPATGDDMTQATMQALKRFSGSKSYETVAVADGIGAMVQTAVEIPSDMPILTS